MPAHPTTPSAAILQTALGILHTDAYSHHKGAFLDLTADTGTLRADVLAVLWLSATSDLTALTDTPAQGSAAIHAHDDVITVVRLLSDHIGWDPTVQGSTDTLPDPVEHLAGWNDDPRRTTDGVIALLQSALDQLTTDTTAAAA